MKSHQTFKVNDNVDLRGHFSILLRFFFYGNSTPILVVVVVVVGRGG